MQLFSSAPLSIERHAVGGASAMDRRARIKVGSVGSGQARVPFSAYCCIVSINGSFLAFLVFFSCEVSGNHVPRTTNRNFTTLHRRP